MLCVVRKQCKDNSMNQVEFISMKSDAISSYEGSCRGRLSNTPREQSKHIWRKGDGLKLIGEKSDKYNWYSSYRLGRGQNRTGDRWDKSGAEKILFYKPDPFFIRSFSRPASDSSASMVDDKSWWHIDSIMVVFLEHRRDQQVPHWKHYSHSGWLDKDIQKVVMIHPLVHHPSMLNSIPAFPVKCM